MLRRRSTSWNFGLCSHRAYALMRNSRGLPKAKTIIGKAPPVEHEALRLKQRSEAGSISILSSRTGACATDPGSIYQLAQQVSAWTPDKRLRRFPGRQVKAKHCS